MGREKLHPPAKLITGLIFKEPRVLSKAEALLKKHFGKIDFQSPVLAFRHTDYYEKEFGEPLKRKFISFVKLSRPETLAKIKIITNRLEIKLSSGTSRLINIDPGYLDLSKLVLATTKDYKHRLYLGKGIYAEVTLFFQGKSFKSWEWTYPDYKTAEYLNIFNQIRNIYVQQIRKMEPHTFTGVAPRITRLRFASAGPPLDLSSDIRRSADCSHSSMGLHPWSYARRRII